MAFYIKKEVVNGIEYSEITITYDNFLVTLCDLGASIRNIKFNNQTMVASPLSFQEFITNGSYYGRTIGRTAGRIEDGTFMLNDEIFNLDLNADGIHNMHGGLKGLAFKKWEYEISEGRDTTTIAFKCLMKDKEDGFPGNLDISVIYSIKEGETSLNVNYEAKSDKKTLLNVSNHSYFNISGDLVSNVLNQKLKIDASKYTKLNNRIICTEIAHVIPEMDFRKFKEIGKDINKEVVLKPTNGYDHCFFFDNVGIDKPNVEIIDEESKIKMTVFTTYPSVVVYTTNYHDSLAMLGSEAPITKNDAICFECQYVPNGYKMNIAENQKGILEANKLYQEKIIYKFENL